jgi:hypothetical protein
LAWQVEVVTSICLFCFVDIFTNVHRTAVIGGTFALYSLISRYAKIRLIPNQQAEDAMVSNYSIEAPTSQMRRAQWVKQKLESSKTAKIILFTLTILGTSMVMGDGTLTPSISGNGNREPRLDKSMIVSQPVCRILICCCSYTCCSALCSEWDQRKSTKPESE